MHESYPSLPGFEHVLLEDSYVLDIEAHPGVLTLRIDLLLLPEHPEHGAPEPGHRACFREATVVFPCVRALQWTGQGITRPAIDASGSIDHGSFDSMTRTDGRYVLVGDWGEITLQSDPPTVSLRRTTAP